MYVNLYYKVSCNTLKLYAISPEMISPTTPGVHFSYCSVPGIICPFYVCAITEQRIEIVFFFFELKGVFFYPREMVKAYQIMF